MWLIAAQVKNESKRSGTMQKAGPTAMREPIAGLGWNYF